MSELKANKISPSAGTDLTLGDSGDTVTIPAGVTLAGNIPAANLTGTLPAISGANLTNLPVPSPHTGNVTFPASQLSSGDSNTLDDYEEGNWTPSIQDISGSNSEGQTYTFRSGYYVKIGGLVSVQGFLVLSSYGSLSGNVYLAGFPFVHKNVGSQAQIFFGFTTARNHPAGYTSVCTMNGSSTNGMIWMQDITSGVSPISLSEITHGGNMSFAGTYPAE